MTNKGNPDIMNSRIPEVIRYAKFAYIVLWSRKEWKRLAMHVASLY